MEECLSNTDEVLSGVGMIWADFFIEERISPLSRLGEIGCTACTEDDVSCSPVSFGQSTARPGLSELGDENAMIQDQAGFEHAELLFRWMSSKGFPPSQIRF